MVPQQKTESYSVTVYDCVPETKTESYSVRVPHQVTKEVPVQKCVTVAVEVPVENACGGAAGGCGDAGAAGDAGACGCGDAGAASASACGDCGAAAGAACSKGCGHRRGCRRCK
jgi:hypothetical protein